MKHRKCTEIIFSFLTYESVQYRVNSDDCTPNVNQLHKTVDNLLCKFSESTFLVHTADTDKTRQLSLVRVGGVNKLLAYNHIVSVRSFVTWQFST